MGTYEKEIGKSAHDLELRSEKVRSIIGQVPPSLLRYGALAILATLVILVYVATLFLTSRYIPVRLLLERSLTH